MVNAETNQTNLTTLWLLLGAYMVFLMQVRPWCSRRHLSLRACAMSFSKAVFFEKSKSPFRKDQKRPKKGPVDSTFLRKKCSSGSDADRSFRKKRRKNVVVSIFEPTIFFLFFSFLFATRKKWQKKKTKGKKKIWVEEKTWRFSFCLSLSKNEGIQSSSLSRNVVTQKNDTLYSKILLIKRLCIKTGWIRAPRSRFGPREKHEKHPD